MSKSISLEVKASYDALLNDVCSLKPDLVPYLQPHLNRVVDLIETRGVRVVTIDLPEYGKLFDKSLSSGVFHHWKIPAVFGSVKKGFVFDDLLGDFLYEPHTSLLYKEVSTCFVFLMRTVFYLHKNSIKDAPDEHKREAVRSFFQVDAGLRSPTLNWNCDSLGLSNGLRLHFKSEQRRDGAQKTLPGLSGHTCRGELLSLLDGVCSLSAAMFGELAPHELCGRHGPGAVADVRTGEDKYSFPYWSKKLDYLFHREHHAYANEGLSADSEETWSEAEPPAKLHAVPKSYKTPRLITAEPTAHQFLQQGLMRWFRDRLPDHLRISIDFTSQAPSREAALESSMDGELGTVDLSSASDRLSLWTVERAFSSNPTILSALHAVRSRWVIDSTGMLNTATVLKKYAGQGNATTFPVQSIIYCWCCIAAVLYSKYGRAVPVNLKKLLWAARRVRVFGDDIILPSSSGQYLVEILEHLQLKVNWDKTHLKGKFRESCGMDAYNGEDVTPFYMHAFALPEKITSEVISSWIDVSNNAYRKNLWFLSSWMMKSVPENILRDIPVTREPLGCLSFFTHTRHSSFRKIRSSKTLHRPEVLSYVITAVEVREGRQSWRSLHQYFVERPEPDNTNWSAGFVSRKRSLLKKRWVPI